MDELQELDKQKDILTDVLGELKVKPDMTCPFCDETGFDDIGLKNHLAMYCDEFQKVPIL